MIKRYNLALIPLTLQKEIISLAQQFKPLAHQYLLSDKIYPHMTLYHFYKEENEIESVWKKTCETWNYKIEEFKFENFNCSTSDKKIFWISLLPNKEKLLHQMHATIADILELPSKKNFEPHLTLLNTLETDCEEKINAIRKKYVTLQDKFILSLGSSDRVGQYTGIIFTKKV